MPSPNPSNLMGIDEDCRLLIWKFLFAERQYTLLDRNKWRKYWVLKFQLHKDHLSPLLVSKDVYTEMKSIFDKSPVRLILPEGDPTWCRGSLSRMAETIWISDNEFALMDRDVSWYISPEVIINNFPNLRTIVTMEDACKEDMEGDMDADPGTTVYYHVEPVLARLCRVLKRLQGPVRQEDLNHPDTIDTVDAVFTKSRLDGRLSAMNTTHELIKQRHLQIKVPFNYSVAVSEKMAKNAPLPFQELFRQKFEDYVIWDENGIRLEQLEGRDAPDLRDQPWFNKWVNPVVLNEGNPTPNDLQNWGWLDETRYKDIDGMPMDMEGMIRVEVAWRPHFNSYDIPVRVFYCL